jgi:hypothetical protein
VNKVILEQLTYFNRVNVPKYIESKIQMTALNHLDLPDMGKLRDRMEGQSYYNKLKNDIVAEFAFENIIGNRKFDWEKRSKKSFKRKTYIFENKELNIILFENKNFPKINTQHINNYIFAYVNVDNRVLISRLATKSYIIEKAKEKNEKIIEISDFKNLIEFSSIDELISKME